MELLWRYATCVISDAVRKVCNLRVSGGVCIWPDSQAIILRSSSLFSDGQSEYCQQFPLEDATTSIPGNPAYATVTAEAVSEIFHQSVCL